MSLQERTIISTETWTMGLMGKGRLMIERDKKKESINVNWKMLINYIKWTNKGDREGQVPFKQEIIWKNKLTP